MSSKAPPPPPSINIAVVGLPSSQNDRQGDGVGKSCLIDRFLHQHQDDYIGVHGVEVSQQDYSCPVLNSAHFIYWGFKDLGGGSLAGETESPTPGIGGGGKLCQLHLVEHTEFIDESSHRSFHSANSYMKRAANVKLVSKGKIAYINAEQLLVPESHPDAAKFPDKFQVDSYLLCIDASAEFAEGSRQRQFLTKFIPELVKTKKPCLVVLTKCDLAESENIKAISEFVGKQKKIQLPVFETSSALNLNVTAAVLSAANAANPKIGPPKPKILPYSDCVKLRDEQVAILNDNLHSLLTNVANDFSQLIKNVVELVSMTSEGREYVTILGTGACRNAVRKHLNKLRQIASDQRQVELIKKLKDVLVFLVPVLKSELPQNPNQVDFEAGIEELLNLIRAHEKNGDFFLFDNGMDPLSSSSIAISLSSTSVHHPGSPLSLATLTSGGSLMSASSSRNFRAPQWNSDDVLMKREERIPWSFLQIAETRSALAAYVEEARIRASDLELTTVIEEALAKNEDKVLPGTPIEELFAQMGCSEQAGKVKDQDLLNRVYNTFMRQLDTKFGLRLEELFLEHPELFLSSAMSSPGADAMKESMERLKRIHEVLKGNEHYKVLDGRHQFRQNALMKYNALFVANTGPVMEDPLMPALAKASFVRKNLYPKGINDEDDDDDEEEDGDEGKAEEGGNNSDKIERNCTNGFTGPSSFRWLLDPSDSYLQIALIGQLDNLGKLRQDIKSQCSENDRIDVTDKTYYLVMELYPDFNTFQTANFLPQAAVVLLDSQKALETFEESSRELFSVDPSSGAPQPCFGIPLVVVALGEEFTSPDSPEMLRLTKITNRMQCGVVTAERLKVLARLLKAPVAEKLVKLLISILNKTSCILQPMFAPGMTEMTVLACSLPNDPYDMSAIVNVWARQPLSWYHSQQNSHVFQVCLPERATAIHVTLRSESMMNVPKIKYGREGRSSPLHGYMLFYSTARQASLATAKYLIDHVLWNIPVLLVAVPLRSGHAPDNRVAAEQGPPEDGHNLTAEGRAFANARDYVTFVVADEESWTVGSLNGFYTVCWDKRFSSTNLQKKRQGFRATIKRDLPQLPPRSQTPDSPSILRPRLDSDKRHSIQFGDRLPQPLSTSMPRKEDVSAIACDSGSDSEGGGDSTGGKVADELVKINKPEGGYFTVPCSPNPAAFARSQSSHDLDEEEQYTLPTQVLPKSGKPVPKGLTIPRGLQPSISLEFTQDSDYAEPINSVRLAVKTPPKSPSPKKQSPIVSRFTSKKSKIAKQQQQQQQQKQQQGNSSPSSFHPAERLPPPLPGSRPPLPLPQQQQSDFDRESLYAPIIKKPQKPQQSPPLPPPEDENPDPDNLYAAVIKKPQKPRSEPPAQPPPPPVPEAEDLYSEVIKPHPPDVNPPSGDPVEELYAEVIKPANRPPKVPPPEKKPKPKVWKKPDPLKVGTGLSDSTEEDGNRTLAAVPTMTTSMSSPASPSPKTKKRINLFSRGKRKDGTKPTPPPSPGLILAQEAAKKAATIPRCNSDAFSPTRDPQPLSRDAPTPVSPNDVDSGVYDHGDELETPDVPSRMDDFLFDDVDEQPSVPPRQYLSDFESDNEDEAVEDDEDKMLKSIYDNLAKAGGPSKETSQLYDTLEQYQRIRQQEKSVPAGSGPPSTIAEYSEVSHTGSTGHDSEDLYATVDEAKAQVREHKSPVRDSPVRELSTKERRQNLKIMKQAAKAMARQKKLDDKKRKREEEQRKKDEERRKKAEAKQRRSSKKRTNSVRQAAPIVEEIKNVYFGVLCETVITPEAPVPDFIVKCSLIIEIEGINTEGIYRLSGKHDDVKLIQERYEKNPSLDLASLDVDVTSISSALKAFFKMLPDPLISEVVAQDVLSVINLPQDAQHEAMAQILLKMSPVHLRILLFLCKHLHKVSVNHEVNKMTASNIAIVFWPTLMRPPLMDLANPTKQLDWQKIMTSMIDRPSCIPDPDLEGAD